MQSINLTTQISAPIDRVFDLARSIDAHMSSTAHSDEKAVGGITSGLLEAGETVTWEAKHFGIKQRLTVIMTAMDRPHSFEDKMIKGAFSSMQHKHSFKVTEYGTLMTDEFIFSAPLGFLGRIAELLFLKQYMYKFLQKRNIELKHMAESDEWKDYIN